MGAFLLLLVGASKVECKVFFGFEHVFFFWEVPYFRDIVKHKELLAIRQQKAKVFKKQAL